MELRRYRQDLDDQLRIYDNDAFSRLKKVLVGQKVKGTGKNLPKDKIITAQWLEAQENPYSWLDLKLENPTLSKQLAKTKKNLDQKRKEMDSSY